MVLKKIIYIVSDMLHSIWEPFLICNQGACFVVSLHFRPAVIDNDILVAGVPVSTSHHRVSSSFDQSLAKNNKFQTTNNFNLCLNKFPPDAVVGKRIAIRDASKPLPGHPSHRRCPCQSVFQTKNRLLERQPTD